MPWGAMTSPFSVNVSPRATRQISDKTWGQGFPVGCWCLAWYIARQAVTVKLYAGPQRDQHICTRELGSRSQRAHPKAGVRLSAPLYSACWGWLIQVKEKLGKRSVCGPAQRPLGCLQAPSLHLGAFVRLLNQSGLAQSAGLILWFVYMYYI